MIEIIWDVFRNQAAPREMFGKPGFIKLRQVSGPGISASITAVMEDNGTAHIDIDATNGMGNPSILSICIQEQLKNSIVRHPNRGG